MKELLFERFVSPFGYTHPNDDKRQMCPYCYNEDTQRIIDFEDLKPYVEYHKGKLFSAYSCYCCGGEWHWSKIAPADIERSRGLS